VATFYIQQFGCRATQADGAAIERQLLDRGCTAAASPEAADVVVLNTCTVTSAADSEAREAIRRLHAANPAARIVVTGCYAQRAPQELAALAGVSLVVGNSHKPQIPSLVAANASQSFVPLQAIARATILSGNIFESRDVLVAPILGGEGNHTRPTLKIQDGCNNRCSFCVIPFVRGKSRSLPPEAVLSEINRLCDSGFREIVLSGINLGSWGRDLSPRAGILDLLRRILKETPLPRLRISSIEPLDVTSCEAEGEEYALTLENGTRLKARAVVLAVGAVLGWLWLPRPDSPTPAPDHRDPERRDVAPVGADGLADVTGVES